jgi:putative membrane protein
VRLLIRWIIVAIALFVTTQLVPGIEIRDQNGLIAVLVMAAVLGFANAVIRPILKLLSCGLIVLTLGLFIFVVNALTLWLSSWIAVNWFGAGFYVDGFVPALIGSIVVSVVSFVLSMFLHDDDRR